MIIEKPVLTEEQEERFGREISNMLLNDEADDMFLCGFMAAITYLHGDFKNEPSLRLYIRETSEMAYDEVVKTKKAKKLIEESFGKDMLEVPFSEIIDLVGVQDMIRMIGSMA